MQIVAITNALLTLKDGQNQLNTEEKAYFIGERIIQFEKQIKYVTAFQ